MFRGLSFVAICALPLAMSAPAGAQSFIEVTGGPEVAAPTPLGPPMSIMQRYTPAATTTRDLSLLVDESQQVAVAPAASIAVTSAPAAPAVMASNDLGATRASITVSNVRGFHEQE